MSRRGFSAECQDCPTLAGEGYGEIIRNGVMSWTDSVQAQVEVTEWARTHALAHDHRIKVSRYISWDVEVQNIRPEIWSKVTDE